MTTRLKLHLLWEVLAFSLVLCGAGSARGEEPYHKQRWDLAPLEFQTHKKAHGFATNGPGPPLHELMPDDGEGVLSTLNRQLEHARQELDRSAPPDPRRLERLFWLSDLHAARLRTHERRIRELDSKMRALKRLSGASGVSQLASLRADSQKRLQEDRDEAVQQHAVIAELLRSHSHLNTEQALFHLVQLLVGSDAFSLAAPFMTRLKKDYPRSPFLPKAYLLIGDRYREGWNIEDALQFYEEVLRDRASPLYGQALYKKALALYEQTEFRAALQTFIEVINIATDPRKRDAGLAAQARRGLVDAYSYYGEPEEAWRLFQQHGKDSAQAMLEQLARTYDAQGKFQDSIEIYRQLMKLAREKAVAENGRLCAWQVAIIRNTLAQTGARPVPESAQELRKLVAIYEVFSVRRDLPVPGLLTECQDTTAGMLRELATIWQLECQHCDDEMFLDIFSFYQDYLRLFPKEPDTYPVRYNAAQLLYKLGNRASSVYQSGQYYCRAAPLYTEVAQLDPRGSLAKAAVQAAAVSWLNCLSLDERWPKAADTVKGLLTNQCRIVNQTAGPLLPEQRDKLFPKQPISPTKEKILTMFDQSLQLGAEAKERSAMQLRQALIYYEANRFEEAVALFGEVAHGPAQAEETRHAAEMLLAGLDLLARFAGEPAGRYVQSLTAEVDRLLGSAEIVRDKGLQARLLKLRASLRTQRSRNQEAPWCGPLGAAATTGPS